MKHNWTSYAATLHLQLVFIIIIRKTHLEVSLADGVLLSEQSICIGDVRLSLLLKLVRLSFRSARSGVRSLDSFARLKRSKIEIEW